MDLNNLAPKELRDDIYKRIMGELVYETYKKYETQSTVTQDAYMREYLLKRQCGRCYICHEILDDEKTYKWNDPEQPVMHHDEYLMCRNTTKTNCKVCENKHNDKFTKCTMHLFMVHRKCHEKIQYKRKENNDEE